MSKIVNIHIPKCGGTSFRESLSEHYNIHLDYGNKISRNQEEIIKESKLFNDNLSVDSFSHLTSSHG